MKFHVHKCLDSDGHIIRINTLGDGSGNDLVDKGTAVDRFGVEDLCPEVDVASLNQVSSLVLVHLIFVGNIDELVITEALGVSDVGEVRVSLLAVLADDGGVIKVVLLEELFGVVV